MNAATEPLDRPSTQWANMLAQMSIGTPVLPVGKVSATHASGLHSNEDSTDDLWLRVFDNEHTL